MPLRLMERILVRSIPVVTMLALGIACSHPNREVDAEPSAAAAPGGTEPTASAEAAQQLEATPAPVAPPPLESAAVREAVPTPQEVPPTSTASSETRPTPDSDRASEQAPNPVKAMFEAEQRRVDHQKSLENLAAQRDAAAATLTQYEKDLLAFRNPFLPRPQLAPESTEKLKDLDGAARAEWANTRVSEARAALDAAQKAYDDAVASPPN